MSKETEQRANTIVVNAENEYIKTHVALGKASLAAGLKDEADKEIKLLKAEKARTNTDGVVDEEEQIIARLTKKK